MKFRNTLLLLIVGSFLINSLLIVGYFNYGVVPQISTTGDEIHSELHQSLLMLIEEVEITNDLYGTIQYFNKNHEPVFVVESLFNYNSIEFLSRRPTAYYAVTFLTYNDGIYIVKAHHDYNPTGMQTITTFIYLAFIIMIFSIILTYLITHKLIVAPLEDLTNSIKQYKFGIKPIRAENKSETSVVQNSFADLVDALEEEKETQARIIASISHDIKTPLTAILGYSDRAVNVQLSKEQRMNYLDIIYQKALSMKELTNEFDDYLSHNIKSSLNFQDIVISDLLKTINLDYKGDLAERNINLIVNSKINRTIINVDLSRIKRVFGNIISNSVRFIDGGGKITISAEEEGNFVKFTIADTGAGASPETLRRMFEPLFTTDPSRNISGLGLAICQDIIDNHNGIIYAENNKYGGLSIVFTIAKSN